MVRELWTRDEQLLAFNLYCKLPFGQYHSGNSDIINLAELIGRTPSAIAMKLSNFASFDPYHQGRGVTGLSHASKADKAIWDEFHNDWNNIAVESESLFEKGVSPTSDGIELIEIRRPTETERSVKVRLGQRFFRQTVLASYDQCCCICSIPIPELLIASHIIPWKEREDLRLNPCNGLCLCAIHDRAFDQGFITITPVYQVLVSPLVQQYLPNDAVHNYFHIYQGREIILPGKFLPEKDFLAHHRKNYFRA